MKVSIIIRTYNRGYTISKALCSVLDQSFSDYELIVVDDGSTDDTAEVVAKVAGDRARYIRHMQNRGVGAAFNTGIAAARGEMIAALDSDDEWKPNKLEREVAFLDSHPAVDVVFSDVEMVTSNGKIPSLFGLMRRYSEIAPPVRGNGGFVLDQRRMYLWLLQEVPVKPSASVLRRQVFEKVGKFDESSRSGEDWDFYLRLAHVSHFGVIDSILTVQKWSDDATHRKYWEADKVFLLQKFIAEKKTLGKDSEARRAVNRGISNHCNNLAYRYLYAGRRREALLACYRGFRETGEMSFVVRGVAAAMPLVVRDRLKGLMKKAGMNLTN
jgi:glycosyltransferase involved in cell wall biosynthesis